MASVYSTPGAVTERLTLFLADYSPAGRLGDGGGHAHEGEDIEVLELPLDDARRLARDGGIVDAKTMLLLMYLERERGLPPL
jgi:ADP-ribose pyrophosphatase